MVHYIVEATNQCMIGLSRSSFNFDVICIKTQNDNCIQVITLPNPTSGGNQNKHKLVSNNVMLAYQCYIELYVI